MRTTRVAVSLAAAIAATVGLAGCAVNEMQPDTNDVILNGTLNGAGSSAQASAQETWIAGFQTENSGVTVNYDPTGSGAGRKSFISGGVQFAGSDSALSDEELAGEFAACAAGTKAIDIPVYVSPIAVVFNVEGVDELKLDSATIAKIFSGVITQWNDPAIAALNPAASLPPANITAVHRSDDSGTTKNFSDYLAKTAESDWAVEVSDKFPFASGEGAQGTSGVIEAVSNGRNTIGYADLSKAGELNIAEIKVGDEFVEPSAKAAAKVLASSPRVEGRSENDLAFKLNRNTTSPDEYPLVLVSYLIVCQEYADPEVAALVKAYAGYLVSDAGQAIAAVNAGSAPLEAGLADEAQAAIASIK